MSQARAAIQALRALGDFDVLQKEMGTRPRVLRPRQFRGIQLSAGQTTSVKAIRRNAVAMLRAARRYIAAHDQDKRARNMYLRQLSWNALSSFRWCGIESMHPVPRARVLWALREGDVDQAILVRCAAEHLAPKLRGQQASTSSRVLKIAFGDVGLSQFGFVPRMCEEWLQHDLGPSVRVEVVFADFTLWCQVISAC